MTDANGTIRRLGEITDAGIFERLATAVLRAARPDMYHGLSHPGMNNDGKTVKAPLDGVGWFNLGGEEWFVACAHSTYAQSEIGKKWLHDPATVKVRKAGSKPTQPEGDLRKAIKEIACFRGNRPSLNAMIALTSSKEPDQGSIVSAQKLANDSNIKLDIWSASRIAFFLDNDPVGQWIRRTHLGDPVELISLPLMRDMTARRLAEYEYLSAKDEMVFREHLMASSTRHMLLVGESGVGKTTCAIKILQQHYESGGVGLIIPHETIVGAVNVLDAVEIELRRLEYFLSAGSAGNALGFCSEISPFVVVIEDLNRSLSPSLILNKILHWVEATKASDSAEGLPWQLICPVWPRHMEAADYRYVDKIKHMICRVDVYSKSEAFQAIQMKCSSKNIVLSNIQTESLSRSLGYDPLLISLYDISSSSDPVHVVKNYIDREFHRVAKEMDGVLYSEVRDAVKFLIKKLLSHSSVSPSWDLIRSWIDESETLRVIKLVVSKSSVLKLVVQGDKEYLIFRHDRILQNLCAEVFLEFFENGELEQDVITDPYFSEAIGLALCTTSKLEEISEFLADFNPISLFFALRHSVGRESAISLAITNEICDWLANDNAHESSYKDLRYRALSVLGEIDSPHVLAVTELFRDEKYLDQWYLARLRNGDFVSGLNLFVQLPFDVDYPHAVDVVNMALSRYSEKAKQELNYRLSRADVPENELRSCLILAGYLADSAMSQLIERSWIFPKGESDIAACYLWAGARCYSIDSASVLDKVLDYWAELPESTDYLADRRNSFAAHGLSFKFKTYIPERAIDVLVLRADLDERLRWPITYLLREVDHPSAVEHVAKFLAARRRASTEYDYGISDYSLLDGWRRHVRKSGVPMSRRSRNKLIESIKSPNSDEFLRAASFRVWESTESADDLEFLISIPETDELFELSVFARAKRRDLSVIPHIIKLLPAASAYWWQLGRYVWSTALALELYDSIKVLSASGCDGSDNLSFILSELLMEGDPSFAERILLEMWDGLKWNSRFFQVALYLSTPVLGVMIREVIEESDNPRRLFRLVTMGWGVRFQGRRGVTKTAQLDTLIEYSQYLDDSDILNLASACNKLGWIDYRVENIDPLLRLREGYEGAGTLSFDMLEHDGDFTPFVSVWIENSQQDGFTLDFIILSVFEWFKKDKSLKRFYVVSRVCSLYGTRKTLCELIGIVSDMPEVTSAMRSLEFSVKYRSLE